MQVGIAKSASPAKRTQQLQELLSRVNLVPFDRYAALAAATIRAQLEQQGTPIGQIDVLIAGTTIELQTTRVQFIGGCSQRAANEALQALLNDEQELVPVLAKLAMSDDKPLCVYAQIERQSQADD